MANYKCKDKWSYKRRLVLAIIGVTFVVLIENVRFLTAESKDSELKPEFFIIALAERIFK